MIKWTVQSREDCQRLVDLLDKYGLRLKKRLDYLIWRDAVIEWTNRPRGNRWHGATDNTRMASLRDQLMQVREYEDLPWSGNEFQDWTRLWAREALRVLKPGGHLLSFGGTRTYHRLTCALEDAGFEIRDCIFWLYGTGFPKSKNVGIETGHDSKTARGTALKPACEPIVVARKPLIGTVAANILAHDTGALNIDACRIGDNAGWSYPNGPGGSEPHHMERGEPKGDGAEARTATQGRWPANVLLDEEAAVLLDQQSGTTSSSQGKPRSSQKPGEGWGMTATGAEYEDTGGASRFFYVAKPTKKERNTGLLDGATNTHPTVKPIELMRYLCRLVTPPGGRILDPFLGSGTTGIAAHLEGFNFIGIDRDLEYAAIAESRIAHWRTES